MMATRALSDVHPARPPAAAAAPDSKPPVTHKSMLRAPAPSASSCSQAVAAHKWTDLEKATFEKPGDTR
jgi:hypothetical protein